MRGSLASAILGFVCACSSGAAPPPAVSARAAPVERSCKPEAPVAVTLEARPLGGDRAVLVARATPTAAVADLELALALPAGVTVEDGAARRRFGATAAGAPRALEATVRWTGRRAELAAIARVPVEGVVIARTAELALGPPPPPPRTRTYALPDGERAREVRP